jgi:hypothetical protein
VVSAFIPSHTSLQSLITVKFMFSSKYIAFLSISISNHWIQSFITYWFCDHIVLRFE